MEKDTLQPISDRRSLIAGFSGNILEWYDFTVYGFFATVIGAQFFPEEDKIVQLISALLLIILRLFQRLSVGGEFTGSISFLVEKAPKGKRGFFGSWTTSKEFNYTISS